MRALYRGFATLNPAAAFASAQALPTTNTSETRMRNQLMGEVIETQVRDGNIEEAKLAVELLSDRDTKETMMRELVGEWAQFDPTAAAAYVDGLGEDASSRIKTSLASEWAESDPVAAAAWLSTLDPEDPSVARAASDIIQEWTRYDLSASAEWLNTLPASPELDRAVASYTMRATEEDPGSAMTWAESISNNWVRDGLMQNVAGTWKNEDPEAFEAYVESSGFDAEQKEKLRNAQQSNGRGGPFGLGR